MSKSISFKRPGSLAQPVSRPTADDWVERRGNDVGASETKRLTIDVPLELHRRIKMACAERDQKMADVIRGMLVREFPPEEHKT